MTAQTNATPVEWCGLVDELGYLVCVRCNAAGLGHAVSEYVFGPPHSEEYCDYCADILANMGEP